MPLGAESPSDRSGRRTEEEEALQLRGLHDTREVAEVIAANGQSDEVGIIGNGFDLWREGVTTESLAGVEDRRCRSSGHRRIDEVVPRASATRCG